MIIRPRRFQNKIVNNLFLEWISLLAILKVTSLIHEVLVCYQAQDRKNACMILTPNCALISFLQTNKTWEKLLSICFNHYTCWFYFISIHLKSFIFTIFKHLFWLSLVPRVPLYHVFTIQSPASTQIRLKLISALFWKTPTKWLTYLVKY